MEREEEGREIERGREKRGKRGKEIERDIEIE